MLKFSLLQSLYPKLSTLVLIPCLGLSLSGCSIEQIVYEDAKIESEVYETETDSKDPVDIFIAECNKCIQGDISKFSELTKTYYSSFTPSNQYEPGHFIYQQIKPTQAFEKCAEKANAMGDKTAFNNLMIRPARIARTARFFYIQKDYSQGAYWMQRLININGEQDGLLAAGRIFIQDIRTIDIGVRLLEQSARLGNRDARQMLMGLMQPGSSYYQSITRNVLLDEERTDEQTGASSKEDESSFEQAATSDTSEQTASTDTSADTSNNTAAPATQATAEQTQGGTETKATSSSQELNTQYNMPAIKLNEQADRIKQLQQRADAAAAAVDKQKAADEAASRKQQADQASASEDSSSNQSGQDGLNSQDKLNIQGSLNGQDGLNSQDSLNSQGSLNGRNQSRPNSLGSVQGGVLENKEASPTQSPDQTQAQ